MTRASLLFLAVPGVLFYGCPGDECFGNNDCIDGYACTKDGACVEVEPLSIATSDLPDAVVGENYQVTLNASGGIEPYQWTITTDETWLSMQATTGVLVGIPLGPPANVAIDVTVTDDSYDGQTKTGQYSIEVVHCQEGGQDQCSGHGDCSAGDCTCELGYTGSQCEKCDSGYHIDDNYECVVDFVCGPNSCSGAGDCDDSTGEVECTCYSGYTSDNCGECASGYHDDDGACVKDEVCLQNTCSGHGTCNDSSGEVVCICDHEYGGEFCDECIWFTCMQQVKLVSANPNESDKFGSDVSIDGDYVAVGVANDDTAGSNAGAVYIFRRTGDFEWDSTTQLLPPNPRSDGNFGRSVSISGDYLAVGSSSEDYTGVSYIFYRTGTNSWNSVYTLVSSDLAPGDFFGVSVDISGDFAIVGATRADVGETAGAAYVFRRLGVNTWDTGTKLVSPEPQQNSGFAESVSLDGEYAVVSSKSSNSSDGSVFVYKRTGDNSWDQGVNIVPLDIEQGALFGESVSISGDYIAVGAPGVDAGGLLNSGAAYVFIRTGDNSWDSGFEVMASEPQESTLFGISVDVSDYYVLAGVRAADSARGAAYVFRRIAENSWESGTKISAQDGQVDDQFGIKVSISGVNMVFSAPFHDSEANDGGAAYVY